MYPKDRFDRCTFLFVVAWLLILQILKSASAAPTAADSAVIQYPDYTNGALLRRPIQKPMVHDPPNRKQLLPTDVINNIETPSDSGSQENAAGETKWTLATITIQNAFLPVGQLADAYPGVDNDQAASGMSGTTIVIIVVVCLLLFLIVAVALFIWWYFFCERKSKEEKKLEELAEKIPKEEEATLKSQITEMEETATEKELKTVPGVSNKETSRNGGNGEGGHRRSTEDGDDGRSSALAVNANYNFVFDSTTSSTVTSSKTSATTSSDKEKKKRKRKRSSDSIEDTSLYRQLLAQIVSIISSMEKPKSRRNKGQK